MIEEQITHKLFRERVIVKTHDLQYVEFGEDFTRFRTEDGRLFEVKLVEKKKSTLIKD